MKMSISLSAAASAIKQLEALITRASEYYYNKDKFLRVKIAEEYPSAYRFLQQHFDITGRVNVIDNETFDALVEILTEEKPDSKVLKRVRAPARGKAPKVKLKHWMGSLDKRKPANVDAWLQRHPGPYVLSNKEDGTSLQINYTNGDLKIYKGGDGDIGQDVSFLIPHLKLPSAKKIKGVLDVRAEVIMSQSAFDAHWSKEAENPKWSKKGYENARNLASGVLNKNEVHEAIGDIDVIVYEIMSPSMKPSEQFAKLKQLGFHVAPYKVYKELDSELLQKILRIRKEKTDHEMDGLVITQDKKVAVKEGSNPTHSIAFKVDTPDVETVVTEVVWAVSKNNLLKPRINIKPVRLQGITINFATGHNAFFIQHGYRLKDYVAAQKAGITLPEAPIGPGAVVRVTRRGDVIPHIVSVVKPARRASMPNTEYTIKGPEAVMKGATDLSEQKRITHFFVTLKVEGIKLGVITKMYAAGLNSILKIIRATPEHIMEIEGFQERSATKLTTNIKQALKTVTLPQLMDASGVFGQGMGTTNLTAAVKHVPNLLTLGDKSESLLVRKFVDIPTFSDTRAKQLAQGLPKFLKFYKALGIKAAPPAVVKAKGSALKGQVVVFTGFRPKSGNRAIEEQGGTVGTGVSKTTTILVAKNSNERGTKLDKARSLGITILSPIQFEKKYGVHL